MTNIEQEFFKTFGIEPKMLCDCEFKNLYDYSIAYGSDVCIHAEDEGKGHCKKCKLAKQTHPLYPEITDRVLLELIGILNEFSYSHLNFHKYSEAQDEILQLCIDILDEEKHHYNEIVEQVQSLFREGEE